MHIFIMDPFSITVGLRSLLSFSGSCAINLHRVVHNARYALDEILAIANEVSDENVLLSDIEVTDKALGTPGVPSSNLDLKYFTISTALDLQSFPPCAPLTTCSLMCKFACSISNVSALFFAKIHRHRSPARLDERLTARTWLPSDGGSRS